MEPFARRPIDRMPARRPNIGMPARPAASTPHAANPAPIAQPQVAPPTSTVSPVTPTHAQPTKPSFLQPLTFQSAGPSMDIRPSTPARPMAAQPSGPARPMVHHPVHPQPLTQPASIQQPQTPSPFHQQPQQAVAAHVVHPAPHMSTQQTLTHHEHPEYPRQKPSAESHNTKHHKELHATIHTGLVGFITFLVVGGLFLAPLLPGTIWQNAPGSSASFSTGDQNLDCLTTLGRVTTTVSYNSKIGFPLTYNYSTTSNLSASCEGKTQHAIGGHTSQFSPLALLIDFALALGIAIASSKIWRKIRAHKD